MTHARGLGAWLSRAAPRSARGVVTIAIVSDARMRSLNKQFRGVDKVTDVLSFPEEVEKKGSHPTPFLGEIVIAVGIASKQAKIQGHSVVIEFRVLALHGLLHLLGYDHQVDDGQMGRVEARLRRRAGLPPGLIARTS